MPKTNKKRHKAGKLQPIALDAPAATVNVTVFRAPSTLVIREPVGNCRHRRRCLPGNGLHSASLPADLGSGAADRSFCVCGSEASRPILWLHRRGCWLCAASLGESGPQRWGDKKDNWCFITAAVMLSTPVIGSCSSAKGAVVGRVHPFLGACLMQLLCLRFSAEC